MTALDLAVVGSPFLDLTFEGLPELPARGREVYARALHATPGGTGMIAIGAARLELRAAVVSPIGRDPAGQTLRRLFDDEGVRWIGRETDGTPVTAIFPVPDGAAMATFSPGDEPTVEEVASADAGAVVLALGRLGLRPPEARVYAVTGPGEVDRFDAPPEALAGADAIVLNRAEAQRLTGQTAADDAALALARLARTAVVTCGRDGAVGAEGTTVEGASFPADAVDPTGAGDLFVAAYAWADRRGMDLAGRVVWPTLYASLSVTRPTALAGALPLEELVEAARRHGLALE